MDPRTLPRLHPLTGEPLVPVGYGRRGPIWPILGGAEDDDEGNGDDTADDPDEGDDPDGSGQDPEDEEGFDALPDKTKAELRRLRRLDQQHRATVRQTAKERDDAKALAERITAAIKGEDGQQDPEKLNELLTEKDQRIRQLTTEQAAERAIRKHKGDHETLLDSRTFTDALGKLDPDDDGFTDALDALVKDTVASSDRYRARKPRPGSGSGEHGGGEPKKDRPKNLREAYSRRTQ